MAEYINLAYYQKKDWKRFLEIIEDRENMHETWEEWNKTYSKTKRGLSFQGFIIKDFVVNLDELINYCKLRGIKIDGKARSQFVSNK